MNPGFDSVITLVSGVPRSGTSMIMQMLQAGGMPILTDGVREPDMDNPRGYLEFEPVKCTTRDTSWVAQARGKAVKIAYPLLPCLPGGETYRVIIPQRDVREVVASQNVMLARSRKLCAPASNETIASFMTDGLRQMQEWLARQPNFSLLLMRYALLIAYPHASARKLRDFCGGLDTGSMAAVIDPLLYRQRIGSDRQQTSSDFS